MAQAGVVAVGAEHQLGHVVGADGEPVDFLDEFLGQHGVARNLGHDDDLQAVVAGLDMVHLLEVALHGADLFEGAHEGQHEVQVRAAEGAAGQLEGLQLPVVDVARHAAETEHGVVLMPLEQQAAQKVAVLVGLVVRGAVDDGLAVEGHGEEGQALGQGLDVELLAAAVAAGLEDLADLLRQGADRVHLLLQADLLGHVLAHGGDLLQGGDDDRVLLNAGHVAADGVLDLVAAALGLRVGTQGLQFVGVAHDDGHVVLQVVGGLQDLEALGGELQMLVELLVQFAQLPVDGQNLVGALGALALGQLLHLAAQARDDAHIAAQLDVQGNDAGGHLLGHDLGQVVLEDRELLGDHALQGAQVVGLQGQGMDADVAEHELGAQQAHLEIGHVAQTRQEEGLAHVGQDEADLGLGGRQFADVDLAAHVDQRQKPAVDLAARAVHGHVLPVQGA
ncbi:hypothetical protein DSECCO2_634160 [anaerobic digester metagenome]